MSSESPSRLPEVTCEIDDVSPSMHIVCIGSSAGGLQAIESLFGADVLSPEHAVCFVLVMHMAADHESIIANLLSRYTKLEVIEITSGVLAEANRIYFVPGNYELSIIKGRFHVSGQRSKAPIDHFLKSLAADQGPRSIAVILSGAASDGSQGIQHVKNQGGLVIAQDPDSAQQSGMPSSAIESKAVDLILPPSQILAHILKWIVRSKMGGNPLEPASGLRTESTVDLQRVLFILKASSGHDFTLYKKNTIKRRLERRMVVQGIDNLSDYVRFLEDDPIERNRLLQEILIGVTNFFRDPEAFEVLKKDVLPHIRKSVGSEKSLRIWVPGCSTGQEAYSIAMVILESGIHAQWDFELKIFASDIDKEAIEYAREGFYPHSISEEVSPERLARFFSTGVNGYQIRKEVKEKIIFAHHNVARDPPFSKLDLISCRNLMIYMEPVLQQKVLRIFHYSLKANGILFMGSSEAVGEASPMFSVYDKKWKFFKRKSVVLQTHRRLDFEAFRDVTTALPEPLPVVPTMPRKLAIREISQEALLHEFVPPTIVCDELGEILYIHGRTGRYLEPSPGEARLNIFAMAREEVKLELSRGFQKVLSTHQDLRYADLRIKRDNEIIGLDITMRLLNRATYPGRMILVTFEEGAIEPISPENSVVLDHTEIDERNLEIERELLFTREHMQTLVGQLETSNEELKSMNEELQSSNEELQSSNEELETAKEELQAVNEELVTLNAELQEKVEELSTANSDLDNFLSSSSIATIFLNRRYLITRYSRSTVKLFNLIPSDIGRSLGDIASQVKYEGVLHDAEEVLEHLTTVEKMVELKDGRWLCMRITPYKTVNNVIDGVVIAFSDVSETRRLEDLADLFQKATETVGLAMIIFDKQADITYASPIMYKELGFSDGSLIGIPLEQTGFRAQGLDLVPDELIDWSGDIEFMNQQKVKIVERGRIVSLKSPSRLRCIIFTS